MENVIANKTHTLPQGVAQLVLDFKGLDVDIFYALPLNKQQQFYELTKAELMILAESAKNGASVTLETIFSQLELNQPYTEEIKSEISALLEFGTPFNELCLTDKETAQKHEIRDEFGHFSRIMGLDAVLKEQNDEDAILDAETTYRQCKDFHRFLMAINERGVDRGYTTEYLPVHSESNTEGRREINANYIAVYKNKTDNIVACVFTNNGDSQESRPEIKELADVYERFLTQYPFEVSNLLLDYYAYLRKIAEGIGFIGAQEYVKDGIRYVKTVLIGNASIVQLSPKSAEDFFTKKLTHVISPEHNDYSLGGHSATPFQSTQLQIGQKDIVLLIPTDITTSFQSTNEFEEMLNKKGSTGKILPANNLQEWFATQKIRSGSVVMRTGTIKEYFPVDWNTKLPQTGLEESEVVKQLALSHTAMNIETAHVHADRNEGLSQRAGVLIANYVIDVITKLNPTLRIERTAMIDEYHVINRINYDTYFKMLEDLGYPLDELTLESSPVVKALSHDILKYVLTHHSGSEAYSVLEKGNNIYLTYDNGQKVIELIEDYNGEFVSGCILFDIALTLYKRYPSLLQSMYLERNPVHRLEGINSDSTNLHELMVEVYQHELSPAKRDALVEELIQETPMTFSRLQQSINETPYLDAIMQQSNNEKTAVVNVLEEFYRPQQGKHNRFLSFLGFPLLYTLYFNGSTGNAYLEQTLI